MYTFWIARGHIKRAHGTYVAYCCAKVVGATSSEGFLVIIIIIYYH